MSTVTLRNSAGGAGSHQADVLLVTVNLIETQAVLEAHQEQFQRPAARMFVGDKTYYDLGEVAGAYVALVQSEMGAGGPGAALLTVQKGIDALTPAAVVMVGVAFGVNEQKQAIGDILISQQLWLYDLQRIGTDKIIPRGDKVSASPRLINYLRSAELYWGGAEVHFGLLLAGEKLVDNISYRNQLIQFEPEAIGGEMEGAGLYVAASDRKVDWILVKAICDWADGNKSRNKQRRQRLAARNAAAFVFHALSQGGFARQTTLPPNTAAIADISDQEYTVQLRLAITNRIDIEELRLICFDLRVDFDDLRGEGKAARLGALIEYLDKRNALARLEAWLRKNRPDIRLP